jgi:alpha-tubulin suppressor-like RCC1 family protein
VNDDAALGRITKDVPDPNNPSQFLNADLLTTIPQPLQTLVDDGFRALKVAAGDSISAAISTEGELRVWGSFRVRSIVIFRSTLSDPYLGQRGLTWFFNRPDPPVHSQSRSSE